MVGFTTILPTVALAIATAASASPIVARSGYSGKLILPKNNTVVENTRGRNDGKFHFVYEPVFIKKDDKKDDKKDEKKDHRKRDGEKKDDKKDDDKKDDEVDCFDKVVETLFVTATLVGYETTIPIIGPLAPPKPGQNIDAWIGVPDVVCTAHKKEEKKDDKKEEEKKDEKKEHRKRDGEKKDDKKEEKHDDKKDCEDDDDEHKRRFELVVFETQNTFGQINTFKSANPTLYFTCDYPKKH